MLVPGSAELHDSDEHDEQERQDQRELDGRLAAR
jgi:hypothetical protein